MLILIDSRVGSNSHEVEYPVSIPGIAGPEEEGKGPSYYRWCVQGGGVRHILDQCRNHRNTVTPCSRKLNRVANI